MIVRCWGVYVCKLIYIHQYLCWVTNINKTKVHIHDGEKKNNKKDAPEALVGAGRLGAADALGHGGAVEAALIHAYGLALLLFVL